MSDMFELKAIEMIAANLKAAVDDGNDVATREAMSLEAQYIAGGAMAVGRWTARPTTRSLFGLDGVDLDCCRAVAQQHPGHDGNTQACLDHGNVRLVVDDMAAALR